MTPPKVHFAHLDGLRTLAFLGVFLFHCYYSAPPPLADHQAYRVLHFLTGNGDPASTTLSVLWSIAVEEQFYLAWPLLLVAFRKRRSALFGLIILGSLAFRCAYADKPLVLFYHTGSVLSDLAIGGLLGWYSFMRGWKADSVTELRRWQIVAIYGVGLLLILFRECLFTSPPLRVLERVVYASFFAFVLFEQTFAAQSFYKAGRFTLLDKAGKYTYGLYCLHLPAMVLTVGVAMLLGMHEAAWWAMGLMPLVTLGVSTTLSLLSFHAFEKHFLQLKEKYSQPGRNHSNVNRKVYHEDRIST
jgi:peptidoglycan/LPS O-acetylase OafA/YrhL